MSQPRARARRSLLLLDTWLPRLMWTVVGVGTVSALASTGFSATETPQTLALVVLALFFLACCAGCSWRRSSTPAAGPPRWLLLAAIVLWAVGSVVAAPGRGPVGEEFPGLAELFFFPPTSGSPPTCCWHAPPDRGASAKVVAGHAASSAAPSSASSASLLASPLGAVFGDEGLGAAARSSSTRCSDLVLVRRRRRPGAARQRAGGAGHRAAARRAGPARGLRPAVPLGAAAATAYFVQRRHRRGLRGRLRPARVRAACTAEQRAGAAPARAQPGRPAGRAPAPSALLALVLRPAGLRRVVRHRSRPSSRSLAAGARLIVALREAQGAAEARQLSRTDELTGLLNRRAILADVDRELRRGPPGLAHAAGPRRLQGGQRQPGARGRRRRAAGRRRPAASARCRRTGRGLPGRRRRVRPHGAARTTRSRLVQLARQVRAGGARSR